MRVKRHEKGSGKVWRQSKFNGGGVEEWGALAANGSWFHQPFLSDTT